MRTFEQLLDARVLTASYSQRPDPRTYHFTDTFFTGARDAESNEFEFIYWPSVEKPAPGNIPGAEARILTPRGGTKRYAALFRAFNMIPVAGDALSALREPESFALQQKGEAVMELIMDEFGQRHKLYKELIIALMMVYGRVNMNQSGEVLAPTVDATSGALTDASGTVISADFGIADSHRGNLGGLIAAPWSTDSTKIFDHLDDIDDKAEEIGVPTPTEIYIHNLKKRKIRDNTQFQTWAKESNVAPDTVLRGGEIKDLWGKNWHFLGHQYKNASDTMTDFLPQTHALILPPDGPWKRCHNGSELVPSTIGHSADWRGALGNLNKTFGQFAYATVEHNPVRLQLFLGDNFGMNFPEPNALWLANAFA